MSFLLPPTVALKSSYFNSYVQYNNYSVASNPYGFLKIDGRDVFSPLAKFEVVSANTGTGLVHIRCSRNKKFLRLTRSDGQYFSPEAAEKEEDHSKWTCTLFMPKVHKVGKEGKPNDVRLYHVSSKLIARAIAIRSEDNNGIPCMKGDRPEEIGTDRGQSIFHIIDLGSLKILPRHVAFKGDNDLYLRHCHDNLLRFISTDKGIAECWFEVSTDGDGYVTIKAYNNSLSNKNYLRYGGTNNDDIIYGDGEDNSVRPPSKFLPVKVDNSTVGLKCLANNRFCKRYTDRIEHGLNANEHNPSISRWSRLRLEELVLSRTIYDSNFDLTNATIYGVIPVIMATADATNPTSADNTLQMKFSYTESKSSTWTASHSWMVGITAKVTLNIPVIAGTEVTASAEYSGSYDWGETVTTENRLETTYSVTVPAYTSISVSLMATKGTCDVPYSYFQRDVLHNGETVVYKKTDGLYTGVNSYNYTYKVKKLEDSEHRMISRPEQM